MSKSRKAFSCLPCLGYNVECYFTHVVPINHSLKISSGVLSLKVSTSLESFSLHDKSFHMAVLNMKSFLLELLRFLTYFFLLCSIRNNEYKNE